jgi:hypothetical protein
MQQAKIHQFFNKPFFVEKKYIIGLWILAAVVTGVKQYATGSYNNYLIFKHVFYHLIGKENLYLEYPELYFDHNHYGSLFGVIIAPFAILPDFLGTVLWNVVICSFLIYAILQLPIKEIKKTIILWLCFNEVITSLLSYQFNLVIAGIIVLSFVCLIKEKEFKGAMAIMVGTFVKLYGIVGLSFFFFSKNKIKFIGYLLLCALILMVVPMVLSNPEFVLKSYVDWYDRLTMKNMENANIQSMQDISVMGMVKRISGFYELSNLPILGMGLLLFGLPYLNFKSYNEEKFRLLLLASTLIFTVIFSSGSESPTYIIAFVGVAIWFVLQPKDRFSLGLLLFALLLTSFSATDIFPKIIRETYIKPYALKALPCFVIWLVIIYQMVTFKKETINE